MSDESESAGIGSVEAFRCAQRAASLERLRLPQSGLPVILARPSITKAMEFNAGLSEHAEKLAFAAASHTPKRSDILAAVDYAGEILTYVFEQPRFCREPKEGEITFGDLLLGDVAYIFQWACYHLDGSSLRSPDFETSVDGPEAESRIERIQ